jgi:hypothetical protein
MEWSILIERVIKLLIGCLVLYFIGWFSNRKLTEGYSVPKFVSFICGKKDSIVSVGGLIAQWLAVSFFIGALIPILTNREDLINFGGITGWLVGLIILGITWLISIKKFRL